MLLLYNRGLEGSLYYKCIGFEFNFLKLYTILSEDVYQSKLLTIFYDIIAINLIYFTIVH